MKRTKKFGVLCLLRKVSSKNGVFHRTNKCSRTLYKSWIYNYSLAHTYLGFLYTHGHISISIPSPYLPHLHVTSCPQPVRMGGNKYIVYKQYLTLFTTVLLYCRTCGIFFSTINANTFLILKFVHLFYKSYHIIYTSSRYLK